MKTLYLVDVSSMYFRAYYAIRPLHTSKGLPTNALFGFLSMVVKLLKDLKPDYVAFCFDRQEVSFRKEIFKDYKANRSEMPEDLKPQVPYISKLSKALGIACLDKAGYEADDIIGTLAHQAREKGVEVVIVSGDKDFAQLIGPNVSMLDTLKDVKYDPAKVVEKWGVAPEQFIDYLALVGDSSDNIPGVRGVGPKGAQKLLAEYQSLSAIYEHLADIKNKGLASKLAENKEMAFLSRKLVTIETNVELPKQIEDLKIQEIKRDDLTTLLEELEFTSFLRSLLGNNNSLPIKTKEIPKVEIKQASQVFETLSEQSADSSALEKLINPGQLVWGISAPRGLYLGLEDKVFKLEGDPHQVGKVLSEKKVKWAGYDVKKFWHEICPESPEAGNDLMLSEYLLKGGKVEGFESLYQHHVGQKFPDLAGGSDYYLGLQKISANLNHELEQKKLQAILRTIDLPLVAVLYSMEKRGILVDTKELSSQSTSLASELKKLEQEIIEEVGIPFNLGSPKQLADVLFNKLKIPPVKKTKTGFSTDSDVLEKLSKDYPVCKKLIEHREVAKLKSTYVDTLPQLINPETKRLHTHFNQVGTATGRLSSHDPNLQNIPIRTSRGTKIRRTFISDKGCEFISSDYSQIELRLLAHITGDEGLCEAFAKDQDIHTATASRVFNVGLDAVTPDLRRMAKAINFGIAYGQGAFGLAESLGIGRKEASEIITNYFVRFKKVKDYMTEVVEEAKAKGFVETIFGRRRYLPELKSGNAAIRKFGERAAINAPMQGTASDLVKLAMIEVVKGSKAEMLLQVHDELLFEVPIGDVPGCSDKIRSTMEKIVELKVPMKVNISHGANWEEAHA